QRTWGFALAGEGGSVKAGSTNLQQRLHVFPRLLRSFAMPVYSLGPGFEAELPEAGDYWVAPDASVIGRVRLGRRASVWFGATLRGDSDLIAIGDGSNVQDGAVLHTDTGIPLMVGRNVTIGHMAMIHGATIGDNSLIGIGAIVLNRASIGRNCIVGAGALITEGKTFPDNS